MKTNKVYFIFWGLIMSLSLVLTACTPENALTPTEANPTPIITTPTTTAEIHWWDKFGEPKYGGTLTIQVMDLATSTFDPSNMMMRSPYGYWLESLFFYDWTLDRNDFAFTTGYVPQEYWVGWLAKSWEQTDTTTWTVYLNQGIHWQDKPPVNGRELTADDVQYTFDRLLGTGSGFTEPNMFWAGPLSLIDRVVATDRYTVEFRLKIPSVGAIDQILQQSCAAATVPREWVEQCDLGDWEALVGTGPWIVTDCIPSVSMTCSRNPDYWGSDARYPDNAIPYLDEIKEVAMPDLSSAIAALRTGKINIIPRDLTWQQQRSLSESNPDIQVGWLPSNGYDIELRCDTAPFNDIKVRKALQMAINRPLIAQTHYGGTVDGIPCGVAHPEAFVGWVTPYVNWPQDLKDEYSYNPDMAKQLLADAGYADGFETNCYAVSTRDLALLEIIKAQFQEIGVDMKINVMDEPTFRSWGADLKHDQMMFSWNTGMFFTPPDIIRFRESTNTRDNWTLNNDSYYDSLVAQFNACSDLVNAKQIFNEADMYLLRQHWSVQVFPIAGPVVWHSYVKGYSGEITGSGSERGYYGARMWLDKP